MANLDQNYPVWPGWETVRLIGKGASGSVYEIQRNIHGKTTRAAMKVIQIPEDEDEIDDFKAEGYDDLSIKRLYDEQLNEIIKEYNFMRSLNGNTNIVNCDDFREEVSDDGIKHTIYIRMELLTPLLDSDSLSGTVLDVVRLGKDLCRALVLCSKENVIHRDIKPQNIFTSENGSFKLGDFGISKTIEKTTRATKAGTPEYMAPEIVKGEKYNRTVDIYSLGLVLYWMLNDKRLPFVPNSAAISQRLEARERRLKGERFPKPNHGTEDLYRIILKACEFKPERRFQSAKTMLLALEKAEEKLMKSKAGNESLLANEDETKSRKRSSYSKPLNLKRFLYVGIAVAFIFAAINMKNIHVHAWSPATCTEPETCSDPNCGKTRGEPLGHQFTDLTCTEDSYCTICSLVAQSAEGHLYMGGSCTEPSVCEKCGDINAAAGHHFTQATCTAAETCLECGFTQGTTLEHSWLPATLASPQTCSVCGQTSGNAIEVGDIMTFGHYEQDGNRANGSEDIEWIVVEKDDNKAMLVSKYGLDMQPFNETQEMLRWSSSSIRTWLNNDFYNAAFSSNEQSVIELSTVTADQSPYNTTNPGEDTEDHVFLLSINEVLKYFENTEYMKCEPTYYASSSPKSISFSTAAQRSHIIVEPTDYWWLRTPGQGYDTASFVRSSTEKIARDAEDMVLGKVSYNHCIRPAIWIEYNSAQ